MLPNVTAGISQEQAKKEEKRRLLGRKPERK
jgi:hypothetical protein